MSQNKVLGYSKARRYLIALVAVLAISLIWYASASGRRQGTPGTIEAVQPEMPYGPAFLPLAEFSDYTGTWQQIDPENTINTLETARATGTTLILELAGPSEFYQNADDTFNLTLYKERLDRFKGIDFTPYVVDGTVIGHFLIDEPHYAGRWGGAPIPMEEIQAAAVYAKSLFPTMPTTVSSEPSFLEDGAPWTGLDFSSAQYTDEDGDVATWLATESALAQELGLGLAVGINLVAGNNFGPVTAEQIEQWGGIIVQEPTACYFNLFRYNDEFFSNPTPEIAAAIDTVGQAAAARTAPFCRD